MFDDADPIDEVRECFRRRIPEVAGGGVDLVLIARDQGSRTLVAVRSADGTVDPVSACSRRLKELARDLGEKIGVILYSAQPQALIHAAVLPTGPVGSSRTPSIVLDDAARVAWVEVEPDSVTFLSTPGHVARLRLVSKLVGWEVRITAGRRGGRGA